MENRRLVLAFGRFGQDRRAALAAATLEAACDLDTAESPSQRPELDEARVLAILVDSYPGAEQTVLELRRDPRRARVPILALCHDIDDLSFASAFSWGADDAILLEKSRALTARLRALPRSTPEPSATRARGTALIADADPARRMIVGRVLRNAGYDVRFAVSVADAWEFSKEKGLELVVMSTELDVAPREIIEQTRATGCEAAWIVRTAPRDLKNCRDRLSGLERATVTDSFAPVENVLFLANEYRTDSRRDQRTSTRILYGTTVAFRGVGRHEDEFGFTYNVSEGGLYVRTLDVPKDDGVWLELCPPRSERRVRLVAQVQWRRPFDNSESATIPPGFGVKLVDGARADLESWNSGYAALAETLG